METAHSGPGEQFIRTETAHSRNTSAEQGSVGEQFIRTEMVLGRDGIKKLAEKRILVFGCGGVGGYALEALGRSGIGAIDLVDGDVVDISNLNRQLIALHSTLGKNKAEVMAERLLDINPTAQIRAFPFFYNRETADRFDFSRYDYVVDAIDSIRDKLDIIERCKKEDIPVISSMGAGKKTDATRFRVADIYETSICPLARVMRRELRKRGIESLKVVYSTEPAAAEQTDVATAAGQTDVATAAGQTDVAAAAGQTAITNTADQIDTTTAGQMDLVPPNEAQPLRKKPVGSVPWIPATAGLLLAGEVILELRR